MHDRHHQILQNAVGLQRLRLFEPHHIHGFLGELAIDLNHCHHATSAKDLNAPTDLVPLSDSRRPSSHGRYQMTHPMSHSTMFCPATMSRSTRRWKPCHTSRPDGHAFVPQFVPMAHLMGSSTYPHYETSLCLSPAAALVQLTLPLLLHTLPIRLHSTNSSVMLFPVGPSLNHKKKPPALIAPIAQALDRNRAPLPVNDSGGPCKTNQTPFLHRGQHHCSQKALGHGM